MTTPNKLRHQFRIESGLNTRHAAITTLADGRLVIEFNGIDRSGAEFFVRSDPFTDSIAKQVRRLAQRARAKRSVPAQISHSGERPMAKLSGNLAEHIRTSIARRKERSASSHAAFGKALEEFDAAHDEIDAATNDLESEAQALMQSISDLTNSSSKE